MELKCENCQFFLRHYETDDNALIPRPYGECVRRNRRVQKNISHRCKSFVSRKDLQLEELLIRRQELMCEIEELTKFLKKIQCLAEVAEQIQKLVLKKEDCVLPI